MKVVLEKKRRLQQLIFECQSLLPLVFLTLLNPCSTTIKNYLQGYNPILLAHIKSNKIHNKFSPLILFLSFCCNSFAMSLWVCQLFLCCCIFLLSLISDPNSLLGEGHSINPHFRQTHFLVQRLRCVIVFSTYIPVSQLLVFSF